MQPYVGPFPYTVPPYAGTAARGAAFAWQNRDKIARAARVMHERWKKRYNRKEGASRNARLKSAPSSNIKRREYAFGNDVSSATLDRKTLGGDAMQLVRAPQYNDTIGAAPGMAFHLNGFKICATFRNVVNQPIHVHMAIVQPVCENATITEIKTNFFSNPSSTTDKYADFVDAATNAFWSRTQDCNPLNNNKFRVFTHQKFILQGQVPTDHNDEKASFRHIEKYYKVNKRFEFEDTTATNVKNPLWILVWYETLFPYSTAGLNALEYNINHVGYIRR